MSIIAHSLKNRQGFNYVSGSICIFMFGGLGYSCDHLPEYSRVGFLGLWCNIVSYCDNPRLYDLDGVRIMASLYELTDELTAAQRCLTEMLGNEVITEAEYDDSLAAVLDQHKVKTVGVIAHIKNLAANETTYKTEADKLIRRAKAARKCREFYTGYLLNQMAKLQHSEAGEGLHTAKIKKGSKHCEISGDLAEKWLVTKTTTAPDKTAITRAIKAGETIEGAALVAGPDTLKIN